LAVWDVLMPEYLPEWLRMEKDGIIEIPLVSVKNVYAFGVNRQKKPKR
jgi:hypothetical protein